MTMAQVIDVMGFEGEKINHVSSVFSITSTIYFRESPRKYIQVNFNKNQRATSKALKGIHKITLSKYQSIRTGTKTGLYLTEVNSIMGFDGVKLFTNSAKKTTVYRWSPGDFHSVRVAFNTTGKAVEKSLFGGFPGMVTLEKYNLIFVGASLNKNTRRVSGTGTNKDEVDRIMGFSGTYGGQGLADNTTTYRWAESAKKYIEVKFLVYSNDSKAVSARASGLPGAQPKP